MNKEEILAKSRQENKSQDLYEDAIKIQAGNIGTIAAASVCLILLVARMILGQDLDLGLCAMIFVSNAVNFIFKAIKLKRKHEIIFAIIYTIFALGTTAQYIYNLLVTASIL
jgi:hypothetical protein